MQGGDNESSEFKNTSSTYSIAHGAHLIDIDDLKGHDQDKPMTFYDVIYIYTRYYSQINQKITGNAGTTISQIYIYIHSIYNPSIVYNFQKIVPC